MKRQNKKSRKILNKILIAIAIILLLLYILGLLQKLSSENDFLIKKVQQQNTKIEQLEAKNAKLENTIVYQYSQIKELQHKSVPVKTKSNTYKKEEKSTSKDYNVTGNGFTTTIIATFLTVGRALTTFIPAIP